MMVEMERNTLLPCKGEKNLKPHQHFIIRKHPAIRKNTYYRHYERNIFLIIRKISLLQKKKKASYYEKTSCYYLKNKRISFLHGTNILPYGTYTYILLITIYKALQTLKSKIAHWQMYTTNHRMNKKCT